METNLRVNVHASLRKTLLTFITHTPLMFVPFSWSTGGPVGAAARLGDPLCACVYECVSCLCCVLYFRYLGPNSPQIPQMDTPRFVRRESITSAVTQLGFRCVSRPDKSTVSDNELLDGPIKRGLLDLHYLTLLRRKFSRHHGAGFIIVYEAINQWKI